MQKNNKIFLDLWYRWSLFCLPRKKKKEWLAIKPLSCTSLRVARKLDTTHLWKQSVYTEALLFHKSPSKNKSSNGSGDIMLFIFSRDDVTHTEGIWQRFHFSKNKKWIHFLLQKITLSSFWRDIMQSAKVSRTLEKGKECLVVKILPAPIISLLSHTSLSTLSVPPI